MDRAWNIFLFYFNYIVHVFRVCFIWTARAEPRTCNWTHFPCSQYPRRCMNTAETQVLQFLNIYLDFCITFGVFAIYYVRLVLNMTNKWWLLSVSQQINSIVCTVSQYILRCAFTYLQVCCIHQSITSNYIDFSYGLNKTTLCDSLLNSRGQGWVRQLLHDGLFYIIPNKSLVTRGTEA